MTFARYTVPSGFSAGVLDDHFLFRVDRQRYSEAARELRNVDVLPSGAVRTRKGAVRVASLGGAPRLFFYSEARSGSERGERFIVGIYFDGADARIWSYSLDDGSTHNDLLIAGANVPDDVEFVQLPVGAIINFPNDVVLYWPGTGNTAQKVTWWGEMQGLFSGTNGSNLVTQTDPLATPGRVKDEVIIAGSVVEALIATPGVNAFSNRFKAIDQTATAADPNGDLVLVAPSDISFAGARIVFRFDLDNVLAVNAVSYARGRLILGGVTDFAQSVSPARQNYGYQIFAPHRVIMSRVGMPFCIWPGNEFPDSPIDFPVSAGGGVVLWVVGTESATYIATPSAIAVVPGTITYDTLDIRYIDTVGVSAVRPGIIDNAIIYASGDGSTIFMSQFSFQSGAHESIALNASATKLFSKTTRISVGDGQRSLAGAKRGLFVQDDGRIVSMTILGKNAAFSEYVFPAAATDAVVADGRVFVALGQDVVELSNSLAWDFQSTVSGSGPYTVSDAMLQNGVVGVSGVRNGRRVYLGAFETQAGVIKTKTYDGLGNPTYVDPDFSGYSSLLAGLPIESRVVPFPPVGQDQKGLSVGRPHRVVSVKALVAGTVELRCNGVTMSDIIPAQLIGQTDGDARTGWFDFQGGGHEDLHDDVFEGVGYHPFTICGVVREVAV